MKKQILNNWILKLVSVVCAMLLWIVVYNSEDPVEFERFYNIPVTFENTEILEKEGKVYEVLNHTDTVASISVQAKRSVMKELSKDDICVIANFNNMKMDGTVELEIYSERYASDEVVFKASSEELQLFVEPKVEKSFYLSVETVGEPAEGYMVNSTSTSQNRINISGASSIVEKIYKVVALVDVAGATGDISTSVELSLYDKEGIEISTDRLSMSAESIATTINIYPTKTVPVTYEITGTPAEGFAATGEVTYGLTEQVIMGRSTYLSNISEIVVKGDAVSIEGAEGTVLLTVDIDDYLPSGIYRADRNTSDGMATIEVVVVPILEQEFTMEAKQVSLNYVPDGYFADLVLDTAQFTITVRAAENVLETIEEDTLRASIDIAEWIMEHKDQDMTKAAVYRITPKISLGEAFEVIESGTIEVVVGKDEE